MNTQSVETLFRYPIDGCDVTDHASLEQFREKLDQWDVLINRDEAHSISA